MINLLLVPFCLTIYSFNFPMLLWLWLRLLLLLLKLCWFIHFALYKILWNCFFFIFTNWFRNPKLKKTVWLLLFVALIFLWCQFKWVCVYRYFSLFTLYMFTYLSSTRFYIARVLNFNTPKLDCVSCFLVYLFAADIHIYTIQYWYTHNIVYPKKFHFFHLFPCHLTIIALSIRLSTRFFLLCWLQIENYQIHFHHTISFHANSLSL